MTVKAKGPAVSPTCPPTPPNTFTIPPCIVPPAAPGVGCIILLILALIFLVAGAILMAIAACAPPSPATPVLWIVGIGCAFIGLVLLIIWGLVCARLMCRVLNALAWIFSFLVTTSAILAGILYLLGNPCALGALADAVEWGIALAIVGWISSFTGCRIFTTPI